MENVLKRWHDKERQSTHTRACFHKKNKKQNNNKKKKIYNLSLGNYPSILSKFFVAVLSQPLVLYDTLLNLWHNIYPYRKRPQQKQTPFNITNVQSRKNRTLQAWHGIHCQRPASQPVAQRFLCSCDRSERSAK